MGIYKVKRVPVIGDAAKLPSSKDILQHMDTMIEKLAEMNAQLQRIIDGDTTNIPAVLDEVAATFNGVQS